MVGIMRVAHAESPRVLPDIDPVYARDQFIEIIKSAMSWVAYDGELLAGLVVCGLVSYSWNPKPCGVELHYLFIRPEYRKLRILDEFISRVQKTCDQTGLSARLVIDYGDRPEIKDRLMRMKGLDYLGGVHLVSPRPLAVG